MYFFFHLIAGIILGLLAGDILKDERWVIPFAFGAVIPDLIDKPLGMFVLAGSLDNGRIFFHSLLIFVILMGIGIFFWKRYRNPLVAAVALGVLSHQILDVMWEEPASWLYPLLGSFPPVEDAELLTSALLRDLRNPAEIFAIFLLAGITLLYFKRDRILPILLRYKKLLRYVLMIGTILFALFPVIILLGMFWRFRITRALGWASPEEFIVGYLVFLSLAYLLYRWLKQLPAED